MRKYITVALALLLLMGLYTTAAAAPEMLTVSNASAQTGQTVFVSVMLNSAVKADSVALTYSYDNTVLKAIPGSCEWSVKGDLDNFNNKNAGVWAVGSAKELKGELCVLAFQALQDAKLKDTKVSVTVSLQKQGKEVGAYKASGTVTLGCGHQYEGWTYKDPATHSRTCSLCGESTTGTHTWDDGVLQNNPQNAATQLKVFTCAVCGGTKELEVEAGHPLPDPTEATQPEHTHPPVTMPTTFPQPETRPVPPTKPAVTEPPIPEVTVPAQDHDHAHEETTVPYVDYNAPDHTHEAATEPMMEPVGSLAADDAHAGHDHAVQQNNPKWVTALAVFGTIAVIGTGAVLILKKKIRW